MANPNLGLKRQCQACGTKFFDMTRNPIVCPKCGTVYQAAAAPARSARPAAVAEEEPEVDTQAELVSLEDAEAAETKVTSSTEDDLEIEDDAAPDETFLEEEEGESDDVADLIDNEIEDEEES